MKYKAFFFKSISILLPIILLFLLELVLRLFNYGSDLDHLFLTTENEKYFYLNKNITKRYFKKDIATTGNAEFFKKDKDQNTLRLFVLGESAALGFPYPNNISFSRMLKYALIKTCPEKDVEVINLSFSAINSYAFADFSKELPNFSPDAVLIYGGHNEYYGALGVASAINYGVNSSIVNLMILLKRFRLYQLLESIIQSFIEDDLTSSNSVLMQKVVNDQKIEYGGELYLKGIKQFESNMRKVLDLFSQKNIPVFISTLAVNLKDLPPFEDCGVDSLSASLFFKKGKDFYKQKDYTNASNAFFNALKYDCLRFRAPKEINNIICQLSTEYSTVELVESEKNFMSSSFNKIVGNELLLEHVHPNVDGHKVIAKSFFNGILSAKIFETASALDIDSLLFDYPILEIDTLVGNYACNKLLNGFPFFDTIKIDPPVSYMEIISWEYLENKNWFHLMDELYKHAVSVKDHSLILDILRVRILDNAYDPIFYLPAGKASSYIEDYKNAVYYYEKGFKLKPSFEFAQSIVVSSLLDDNPEKAYNYIDYLIENNQSEIDFNVFKTNIIQIIQLKKMLNSNDDEKNITNSLAIARLYHELGNEKIAAKYLKNEN